MIWFKNRNVNDSVTIGKYVKAIGSLEKVNKIMERMKEATYILLFVIDKNS